MGDQDKAPFNMAINTLERLGGILSDIHKTASDGNLSPEQKQFIRVEQLKEFFSQASPLLGKDNVDKYKERIKALETNEISIMKTRNGMVAKEEKRLIFDKKLQDEIFELEIEIQLTLQDLKFFMPPRRDLSTVVGSFE